MQRSNFINPYNFIPLGNEKTIIQEDVEKSNEKTYTGVIEYSLLTKTPLFITNSNGKKQDRDGQTNLTFYDFFSYEEKSEGLIKKPIIPGVKIKGMLRSNYEILSNSCLLHNGDRNEVYNRRSLMKFSKGVIKTKLEKDKVVYKNGRIVYELYDATSSNRVSEDLGIEALDRTLSKIEVQSWIDERSLVPKNDSPEERERIEKVKEQVEKEKKRAEKIKRYIGSWEAYKRQKEVKDFPVYYRVLKGQTEEDYIMLSCEPFAREVYENKFEHIIGSYGSCNNYALCPACRLFGRSGSSSNIRFTDLICAKEGEELFEDICVFPVARKPRPKCAEFYLKKPDENAQFWTFDYWIDGKGELHRQKNDIPLINGRKFYWHQMKINTEPIPEAEKKCKIRPLKAGVRFSGKLYFERITLKQLNELIYLINGGDYRTLDTKTHGYKFGRGKPLGYGSVALSVDKVYLHTLVKKENPATGKGTIEFQDELFALNDDNVLFDKNVFDISITNSFEKITNFYILKEYMDNGVKVSYPKKDMENSEMTERDKLFNWFGNNHIHDDEKGYDTYVEYLEPLSPLLQVLEKTDDRK